MKLSKPILAFLLIATFLLSTAIVSFAYEVGDPANPKCILVYNSKNM